MSSVNNHRAVRLLDALVEHYPHLSRQLDALLQGRGKELPDWPSWCLMPMAGWATIVRHHHSSDPVRMVLDTGRLSAIGTWRYSKGIYRFDADFLAAIADSTINGPLPSELLFRLPEWSLYVETPGMTFADEVLHGFWVHLEFDIAHKLPELRLLLDGEHKLMAFPLHIGPWTLKEAVDRVLVRAARSMPCILTDDLKADELARMFTPLVSIILYLCSDQPEIDDSRCPGHGPMRAALRKTKRGWRMFPADRTVHFDVGLNTGAKLRQAREVSAKAAAKPGRTVRPHLRRGHWHGFWEGPRDGERRFNVKWLSPLIVANITETAEMELAV